MDSDIFYLVVTIEKEVVPLSNTTTLESLPLELMPDLALRRKTHRHTHKPPHTQCERKRERNVG